jgi:hypothetical protein
MRKLLALVLLFVPSSVWANACQSQANGDASLAATWTSCGGVAPGIGDTVTIVSPNAVTISTNMTIGTSGTTGTIAVTINNGATLTIGNGTSGTLHLRGRLSNAGTLNGGGGGVLDFNPPDGSTYEVYTANQTGTVINLSGTSNTNQFKVTTMKQGTTGGNGFFDGHSNANHSPQITFAFVNISNCGSASTKCIWSDLDNLNTSITNTQFGTIGEVFLSVGAGSNTFLIDQSDFRNCVDTSDGDCLKIVGSTALTSGARNITRTTFYNTSASAISVAAPDITIGQSVRAGDASNVTDIVSYNVEPQLNGTNSSRDRLVMSFIISDQIEMTTLTSMNAIKVQDNLYYSHKSNPHMIVQTGALAGTTNTYIRNICDGDGFWQSDGGDFYHTGNTSAATMVISNSLAINSCGTLFTAGSSGGVFARNNTSFSSFGGSDGEVIGSTATDVQVFRNNLIVKPSIQNGGGLDGDGIHQNPNSFVRQSSLSLDYNGFWQMPGSADAGSPAAQVPALLTHPALGVVSYVDFPIVPVDSLNSVATAGTTSTTLVCSTCNFQQAGELAVQPGDYVLDTSQASTYDRVSSVTNATTLALVTGITGMASGDSFQVRKSYWNTSGAKYGDNDKGQHDLHVDPMFIDKTRTVAKWDTAQGGPGTLAHVAAEAVKLNGFDLNGNPATYNGNYAPINVWNYLWTGFTPTNPVLKAAGSPADGSPDLGAIPVASGSLWARRR